MTIFLYYNPTDEVRGKTRRYCTEIKPNVFVGTVTPAVRDAFWHEICKSGTNATMIYSTNNEQGFAVKSTTESPFYDNYGILLSSVKKTKLTLDDVLAKPTQTLEAHSMDVGHIAYGLMTIGTAAPLIKVLAQNIGYPEQDVINTIAALCALHDIGKLHPDFQSRIAEKNESLLFLLDKLGLYHVHQDPVRHERYAMHVLRRILPDTQYAHITAYHHQGKAGEITEHILCEDAPVWEALQDELAQKIFKRWKYTELDVYNYQNQFACVTLGIMMTADWMASGEKWMSFEMAPYADKQAQVRAFFEKHKLLHQPMRDKFQNKTFKEMFGFEPRPLQQKFYDAVTSESMFTLIEAPCGVGKTELALMLAFFKMGLEKNGIQLCMPTMSTTKGIHPRLRAALYTLNFDGDIPELDSAALWSDDESLRISREIWSSTAKLQAFYPMAVSTLDQALKAVNMYRYSLLNLIGLSNKVIIVDEVHAYDAFTMRELETLIKWARSANIPMIVMSATLPEIIKMNLLKAAGARQFTCDNAYPLISIVQQKQLKQVTCSTLGKKIPITKVRTKSAMAEFKKIIDNPKEGCSAIICKTVKEAQKLAEYARTHTPSDVKIIIYHSQDTLEHKEQRIAECLELFGKNRDNRPKRAVLISTPIIEQSLDIDMDYLYTSLAPIDLIIQRIGRWCRHDDKGTIREYITLQDPVVVFIPEDYEELRLIYDERVLDETVRVLDNYNEFDTVIDVRQMIDDVYNAVGMTTQDTASRIRASKQVLHNPSNDAMVDVDENGEAYHSYQNSIPMTRETTYPTIPIAIVTPAQAADTSFENAKTIHQKYIINVTEYRLKDFDDYIDGTNFLEDVRLYVTENGVVKNGSKQMYIDYRGLIIE